MQHYLTFKSSWMLSVLIVGVGDKTVITKREFADDLDNTL